jgi:hypothetical protein
MPGTAATRPPSSQAARPASSRQRHGLARRDGHATPTGGTEPPPTAAAPGGDEKCELSEEDREWARRIAARLPPLTSRQRDLLGLLLRRRR